MFRSEPVQATHGDIRSEASWSIRTPATGPSIAGFHRIYAAALIASGRYVLGIITEPEERGFQ